MIKMSEIITSHENSCEIFSIRSSDDYNIHIPYMGNRITFEVYEDLTRLETMED